MISNPYIVLIGSVQDLIFAEVSAKLARRDVTLVVLDFRQPREAWPIAFSVSDTGDQAFLKAGNRKIPLQGIRSVFIRQFRQLADDQSPEGSNPETHHHSSIYPPLVNIFPGLVVNPLEAASGNRSKSYQLTRITALGFKVPRTLVTTIPERAREFFNECGGRVIYKSVSSVRSIVQRLREQDFSRFEGIRHCPVQFQEYIPGIDIRVHVVGKRVFGSQIETSSTDYRYTQEESFRVIRAVELPASLLERCLALVESLGLCLAGIDLRRTLDGDYYCFEVNTSPAFSFYEQQTGQRIGDALVDLLCRGTL